MKANDGGPAFPFLRSEMGGCGDGMSLRDWFAGQALIMAGVYNVVSDDKVFRSDEIVKRIALAAYTLADAMLAQREKP